MYVELWVLWLLALVAAIAPVTVLTLALGRRLGHRASSATSEESDMSCDDTVSVSEFKEAILLAYLQVLIERNLSQVYDKDIDRIY